MKAMMSLVASLTVLFGALGFSIATMAEDSEATAPGVSTEESKIKVKKARDKGDQLITNRRFRAQEGSLSDWSINTTWNYLAGSLSSPLDVERPNLNAQGDVALIQSLSGDINVTYRLTKVDRLKLGFGVNMLAPFHDSIETNNEANRTEFDNNQGELDANNPILNYSRIMKPLGVQMILSASYLYYTVGNLTDRGFESRARISANTMYDFGGSKFSAGMLVIGSRFFNNDDRFASKQIENEFAFLPQIEWEINDTFNLRTISRAWWYQQNAESGDYAQLEFTQSVGLGISITRDMFLYPNIQFKPEDISSDATNIGLNASINLF